MNMSANKKYRLTTPLFFLMTLSSVFTVFGQESKLAAWRFESQRQEIAPRSLQDQNILFRDQGTLMLAGNGRNFDNGCWTKTIPVRPGEFYRFETFFLAKKIDDPNRSVLAKVIWQDASGKKIGQPEYPATSREETPDGWNIIQQIYRCPAKAKKAKIELIYRWDADGRVNFGGTEFLPSTPLKPRLVRVASIHHRPKESKSAQQNLDEFAGFIRIAGKKKADIVCLPEGITLVGTGKKYVEAAETVPGPTTDFLGKIAAKNRLYIVAGIYEKDGAAVYNTAVLLNRDGTLAGKYRKVCLPREEIEGGISPGDSFPVFQTDFGKIGLLICWDVFFPEPARMLALQGAEIIFLPIWGGNLTLARARAIENQVFLVSSTYDMKTAVFNREGTLLVDGSDANPVITSEIDLNKQKLWPWLGDFKNRFPREMPPRRALSW